MTNADGSGLSASALAEAVRNAAARRTSAEALAAVIEMATSTAPCDGASITMKGLNRALSTVASSSELINQADQLQYQLNEGPCLDAVWANGLFVIPHLIDDGRWPNWAPKAAELGVVSMLSVHLFTDAALGSLNLYSMRRREFSHADIEAARVVAAHCSVVLAYARNEQNLWQAIDSRNLVGQAQGILMERFGLTPERSFAVLRRYSQQHNRKLARVAEELVSTGRLPSLTEEAGGSVGVDRSAARHSVGHS
jgi:GAF domain-containing protein